MAFITVYNKSEPWKRLVIQLNTLRFIDPRFDGDEGWMLYAKSESDAVDSDGVEIPIKIIGSKTRTIKAFFMSGWGVEP